MKITSFDQFAELARRGTFVPVCKEIVADLLTPVSAFLKIAEHADYAFLLESVEGGEHVGRYSFLGKDPFLILRARDGRTTIERAGTTVDSEAPFIDALRRLMADFRSPFVPDLPRFTGGAVGYFGYGCSEWFEPVLGNLGAADDGADQAGFMLFDTVLAFAVSCGASLLKPAHKTDYGGYSGYFGDPDNHPWEVVVAPGIVVGDDRRVHLAD